MRKLEPKKIVYLFGAGATHAELVNLEPKLIGVKQKGLLINNVSERVIEKARLGSLGTNFLRNIRMVTSPKGSLNIELLISLLENSKIDDWERKTSRLKQLVRMDIESILTRSRTERFYLHKALLEFHNRKSTQAKEKVLGLISLNYDNVLDQAYETFWGEPNYCFSLARGTSKLGKLPLLKLHGSFSWTNKQIRERIRTIEIIPLGSNKNYLHAPYSFIWNQAMEILIECDTLRVIGCSLSQNDAHLIDLLFKAHLEKGKAFDMEIINSEHAGQTIRDNYGFFPKIKILTEIESPLIPEADPPNPFETWLKLKTRNILKSGTARTKYLSKLST